jgi:hypothetical protein
MSTSETVCELLVHLAKYYYNREVAHEESKWRNDWRINTYEQLLFETKYRRETLQDFVDAVTSEELDEDKLEEFLNDVKHHMN